MSEGVWEPMAREEQEEIRIAAVEDETPKAVRMNLGFQVTDVSKPLISVKRVVEKGNIVGFGPNKEDNFILNKASGDKIMLRPNGKGSYMMDVKFVGGGKTEITVDSGAEENVCPWGWGSQFEVTPASSMMYFRNASGGRIAHYGQRVVEVESPF